MDIKNKYAGIQSDAREFADRLSMIGTDGCLFLCLCSIAEEFNESFHTGKRIDILSCLIEWSRAGLITSDLYCRDQEKMLELATGFKWKREVLRELPANIPAEMYTVERWKSNVTGFTHFKRRWGDTLRGSRTVDTGSIEAYYVYIAQIR